MSDEFPQPGLAVFRQVVHAGYRHAVVDNGAVTNIGHFLFGNAVVISRNFVHQLIFQNKTVFVLQAVNQHGIDNGYIILFFSTVGCLITDADFRLPEIEIFDFHFVNHVIKAVKESDRNFVLESGAGLSPDHNPGFIAQLSAFGSDFFRYLLGNAFVKNFAFDDFALGNLFFLFAGSHHRCAGKHGSCCHDKPKFVCFHK